MSKEENEFFMQKKKCTVVREKWFILGIVSLLIGLLVTLVSVYMWSKENVIEIHGRFGITVDAGGSGTRLSIYEYKDGKIRNQNFNCEDKGITKQQSSLSNKIHECLVKAEERIPFLVHSKTPIYFAATAGMRLLKIDNATAYQNIWNVVRQVLNNSSFIVKLNETLLGSKEAAYSWTSVNSLLDREKSSGLFELGSTSFQLAFEPQSNTYLPSSNKETVFLKTKSYNLYVHSYLCFGRNEFVHRYNARIIKKSGYSNTVNDPCHARGYKINLTSDEVWSSPCVSGSYAERVLGESVVKEKEKRFYVLQGSSNFSECYKEVQSMFYTNCSYASCGMNNIYQPIAEGFFTAVGGGVYFSSKYLGLPEKVRLSAYKNATEILCSLNYTQLSSKKEFNKYVVDYCLGDVYTYFLFHDLLKLEDSKSQVMFAQKIGNSDVTWTSGLILNKLYELSPSTQYVYRKLSKAAFFSAITASVVVIMVGILAVIRSLRFCDAVKKPNEKLANMMII